MLTITPYSPCELLRLTVGQDTDIVRAQTFEFSMNFLNFEALMNAVSN